MFSRTFYYTTMGALGSFLVKEAGVVKAYAVLGIVLLAVDFLYRMPISVLFDVAFVASMIMVLVTASEGST